LKYLYNRRQRKALVVSRHPKTLNMNISHEDAWASLERTLSQKQSATDAWDDFLTSMETIAPHRIWDQLREITVENEQQEIREWLNGAAEVRDLPDSIQGFWIGITQMHVKSVDRDVYAYYVVGCDSFSEEDAEWATESSLRLTDTYCAPDFLLEVQTMIADEDGELLDWILPLALSAFVFDDIIRNSLNPKFHKSGLSEMKFAVGYDGGDFAILNSAKRRDGG
jgi:hypothetical protein